MGAGNFTREWAFVKNGNGPVVRELLEKKAKWDPLDAVSAVTR